MAARSAHLLSSRPARAPATNGRTARSSSCRRHLCDLSATVPVLDCVATPPAYVSRLTPGFPAVFLNQSVVIGCRSAGAQEGSRVGFAGGAASSESPRIGTGSCVTWSSPCVSVAADRVVNLCVSHTFLKGRFWHSGGRLYSVSRNLGCSWSWDLRSVIVFSSRVRLFARPDCV